MEVKIRIVPEREAPALVLETPALTPQVERLAQRLSALDDGTLPGFQADKAFLLETARLTCLYAQDKGVYARREDGEVFALRLRLYAHLPLGDREFEEDHRPGSDSQRHHQDFPGRRRRLLRLPAVCEEDQTGLGTVRRNGYASQ